MKFFNIDLHISVIADIKRILNDLGHGVDINYLSNHCWIFGAQPNNSYVINQNNWPHLDQKMCEDFFEKHSGELSKYDGFIITHIPMISLLYEKFKKPIIFVASTRYEYPFTTNTEKWKWFNEYINDNEYIIPLSNNLYDKWYCEQFTNREFKCIPSLCEYTESEYNPRNNQHILYSHRMDVNLPNLIYKSQLSNYKWSDLFSYKSMVHIPYNISTMSIFEQYSGNVPMFFPDKKFMIELWEKGFGLEQLSYTQVVNSEKKSLCEFKGGIDPNNVTDINLINKALELSDFYNFPHINYFSSFNDLSDQLKNTDFMEVSKKMEQFNVEHKLDVYSKWSSVLEVLQ